jgi:cobalt/nickel transport system permease protein
MHLTHEILSSTTIAATTVTGLVAFSAAVVGARAGCTARQLPALCAAGVLIFLAQALNLSTGWGFSGHLLGAALLAIAFGPWSAMLVMGTVLGLQVGLLGDGSWATLGANFINMGLIASWSAYAIYQLSQKYLGRIPALAVAAYASTLLAALALALQVGQNYSGILSTHAWIGLIEVAGSLALYGLCSMRTAGSVFGSFAWKPVACAALLVAALLPFSSELPDGLQHSVQTSAQR